MCLVNNGPAGKVYGSEDLIGFVALRTEDLTHNQGPRRTQNFFVKG